MRWHRELRIDRGGARPREAGAQLAGDTARANDAAPSAPVESPERILTLTDAVLAIAMTLLVLDLNTIDYRGSSLGALSRLLGQEGGRFVAFFIAFWVIAQFWLVHHRLFRRIIRHEDTVAARNFWFLFGISVLPFSTKLLGETHDNPLPVTLFSANLLLISGALSWLASSAERAGASILVTDKRELTMNSARRVTTAILFVLPGALAWVIRPGTAELLFLLLFLADVPGLLLARRRERGR